MYICKARKSIYEFSNFCEFFIYFCSILGSNSINFRRFCPIFPPLKDYVTARFYNSRRDTRKFSIEFKQERSSVPEKFCGTFMYEDEIYALYRICGPVGVGIFNVKARWFWSASSNLYQNKEILGAIRSIRVGKCGQDQLFLNFVEKFDAFPNLEEVSVPMRGTEGKEKFLEILKKLEMKGLKISRFF